jgi:phage repressor protein C with HTH and peptisase S24 domain
MENQHYSDIYSKVMPRDNMGMNTIQNRRARLAELIARYGTQAEFCRQTGENQGEISGLLKEKSFGEKKARKIEQVAGVETGWLDQPAGTDNSVLTDGRASVSARPILAWDDASELGEEYVLIPRLEVKASAGNGRIVWHVDEKGQRQAFRKAWCERLGIKPDQAATIVAEGSSMEPRVRDGDSLVVDYRATELISGKPYVLSFGGEVYVKRIFKMPAGGLSIRSDNPDKALYPDIDLTQHDIREVEIIALVVAVSGAM